MKKLIVLIIVVLVSFNYTNAQILPELEKVKEIKLLESNRDDVRRIFVNLQPDYNDTRHQDTFFTDNSEIDVYYSKGFCNEDSEEWDLNISEWNVAGIVINPKISIALKTLKFDTVKYTKEKMFKNNPDMFLYHNKETGIVFEVEKNVIQNIIFNPPKKFYSLLCDKEQAKILLSTKSLFTRKLKYREIITDNPSFVNEIELSDSAIYYDCVELKKKNKNCPEKTSKIKVRVLVNDPEESLTYAYTVSAGKIIGKGSKVTWDLSEVKPGTYMITAGVDDGCGFCGETKTKTVVVKQCPNCGKN